MPQRNDTTQEMPVKKTFNVEMIKDHIKLINMHINKMELQGKKDAFEFELELLEVFPEFYDAYPFLVKKICKRGDLSILYKMLENLDQVEQGNKSLSNVEHNLGEDLAKQFLYPALKNKK